MNFTDKDIQQIKNHGLTANEVNKQIEQFRHGIIFANVHSAATLDDGIVALSYSDIDDLIKFFDSEKEKLSFIKFVPASGAATRMFKFLFDFLNDYNPVIQSINAYINRNALRDLPLFLIALEKLPFYDSVIEQLEASGVDHQNLNPNEKALAFVKAMLEEDQLNYGG
ncbi:MAG: DUF4301 family protein, partial [Psychroserpens sp.]|nr:DUF4301 family protein [Psychroserpens sp.]